MISTRPTAAGKVDSGAYPLEDSIGFLVSVASRKLLRVLDQQIAGHGITSGTFFYLRVLWQENGISQGDLARRVNTSAPTANAALRKLQAAKLVVLNSDPEDGRRVSVSLTRKGRELEKKILPIMAETNKILSHGMSKKQIDQFRKTLVLLQANAEI
ncbi:MarR family winged helix-turn-helix transcriptional regulator [Lacisediminimonas sp.]|uniref:MarR family winged helix-turn-helix transcriptional regulator n=1 Tax=Lacisediminimonas sp. TaxID=3060582 RepID=UPI00272798FE|nr:MarR family transcriptional regulator [Lacisediminimonas sp.]MDO8299478.1 MarR family transcriptional regulator [Lacisediminimonas sp.]